MVAQSETFVSGVVRASKRVGISPLKFPASPASVAAIRSGSHGKQMLLCIPLQRQQLASRSVCWKVINHLGDEVMKVVGV